MRRMLGDHTDEEFVLEDEAENPAIVIKRLREKLKVVEAERAEYLEGWQRSKADFANFKREEETQRGYAQERIKASLVEDIIPVLDSFEMSAKHSDNKELQILHKQLLDSIKRLEVKRFGEEGEGFDPHKHEAVREVAVEKPEQDHTVVSIERSGYSIGNHIIRPAQVSVGTYKK
jgi:molecular chaperone GrpE